MLIMTLLMAACAKQGFPTGGPKDADPPKQIACKPSNESRYFAEKQFFIGFDEYVVLKNAETNVLVSPPMAQKPEFTTRGKGVLVKIKDTLLPNTTYLFQFKEAIADFTEGNVLPSYEYVFSTGAAMDTQMLAGTVLKARDGKPWGESLAVSAFREHDSVPAFVTRTDKEGKFAFHYIPAGKYRLVAMDDKNKNWLPDSTEATAWDTTLFLATDSIDSLRLVSLRISSPDKKKQRVLKSEMPAKGKVLISTLLPMQTPTLEGAPLELRLNTKRDTLTAWLLEEQTDSARLILKDVGLSDTLKLRYRAPSSRGRGTAKVTKEPLVKPLCDGNKAFYDSLMLAFSRPVVSMRKDAVAQVLHLKDSATSFCPLLLDSSGMHARIDIVLHAGDEYRIRIADSLFTDIYGYASDSLNFKLVPHDYGILKLHINNLIGSSLVIELLDSKDTVVSQEALPGSGTVKFSHLSAGDYRLRAIIDTDGNGHWTTGDFQTGRQPEDFVLFEKTLQLREKWEMEEQWNVGRKVRQTLGDTPIRTIKMEPGKALKPRGFQNAD